MGTPDFAVPSLQSLLDHDQHEVVAVFTQSPKAKGRGLKEIASPIEQLARIYNIPVYNPRSIKTLETKELIDSIEANIIVVVAYGFIIPKDILSSKKYGCLNIHPSQLPKYRGAAPLQHTIINGEKETAVCIMQMDEGLDTGDIILMQQFDLPANITLPELHDKCAKIGAKLLLEVLNKITILPRTKQTREVGSYAGKLSKEHGRIDWKQKAFQVDCKIRGMNPWPGTYFEYQNKVIKILEASYQNKAHNMLPGEIIISDNKNIEVACNDGIVIIKKLQLPGKKAMNAEEFLRGMPNFFAKSD